jgi:HTH-type transcriptional repressor of NAD biosynthesis genes
VVDADRKRVPISGTEIRKEPFRNWSFMPTVVREQFLKRVCIIGTESTGKSTLTKLLAKHFQTSWVEEYGRTFCETELFGDETLLRFDDYGTIAAGRWADEQRAVKSANRVLLADTNAMITNFYCKLYEGRTNPLVTEYEKLENYDLILFLNDDVPWVADGLRINSDRSKTRPLLDAYLYEVKSDYKDRVRYISGNYQERFNLAVALIEDLLNESN